jgi:hypothetical protein
MLVGTPPQLPQAETAARRTTIALALVGLDPATTKCHWYRQHSCYEPAAA